SGLRDGQSRRERRWRRCGPGTCRRAGSPRRSWPSPGGRSEAGRPREAAGNAILLRRRGVVRRRGRGDGGGGSGGGSSEQGTSKKAKVKRQKGEGVLLPFYFLLLPFALAIRCRRESSAPAAWCCARQPGRWYAPQRRRPRQRRPG